jgi:hypothetical protein
MKNTLLILLLFLGIPAELSAQTTPVSLVEFRGHFIGESVSDFLRMEPDAQQEADVCRQRPSRKHCEQLVAAIDRGQRAEVSTTNSSNFVLDGGKLVKFAMLVDRNFQAALSDLTKKFGLWSILTSVPSQNDDGLEWRDQQYMWDTQAVFVTLYQDNNPALLDRRPLLVVESRAEHLLKDLKPSDEPTSVAAAIAPR